MVTDAWPCAEQEQLYSTPTFLGLTIMLLAFKMTLTSTSESQQSERCKLFKCESFHLYCPVWPILFSQRHTVFLVVVEEVLLLLKKKKTRSCSETPVIQAVYIQTLASMGQKDRNLKMLVGEAHFSRPHSSMATLKTWIWLDLGLRCQLGPSLC